MPVITPRVVEYEPVPVRRVLKEMKDYASMMLDLAYYSSIYGDKMMAYEVLKIENMVYEKWSKVIMQTMLAARSPEDAEKMLSIVRVASALEHVGNAAGDIAYVATIYTKTPTVLANAIIESEEIVARIEAKSLDKEVSIEELTSFPRHADVIVVIRGYKWILDPNPEFKIARGDILIVRGTEEAIRSIAEALGFKLELGFKESMKLDSQARELVKELKWLKNIADVTLDLAFHSVIYRDKSSAIEVLEIEEEVDSKILNLLPKVTEASWLSGEERACLARIIDSLEDITDAAAQMASIIVADLPVHEVIEIVEEESNEIVLKVVAKDLPKPTKLENLELDDVGAHVVAVKKASGAWYPLPSPDLEINNGDTIILKIYSEEDEKLIENLIKKKLYPQEESEES